MADAPKAPAEEYVKASDVEALIEKRLRERDEQHAEEIAAVRATMPQLIVGAHTGGPGNDNHQVSWNLAEQEAAARGDVLDHWSGVEKRRGLVDPDMTASLNVPE